MTAPQQHVTPPQPPDAGEPGTLAARFAMKQRAGGIAVTVATLLLAFLMGGIIVAATQHGGIGHRISNTLRAYHQIFDGAGLNWFGHPTTVWFTNPASYNLSQTLLTATPLILTGLGFGFAFRCGLFNIGGQGQYLVGLIVANWVGTSMPNLTPVAHVVVAIVAGAVAGAAWAGIAGVLKASTGAHEVIVTIMLNWIAIWTATWVFGVGGPLQNTIPGNDTSPTSNSVFHDAQLPTFWGTRSLQGLSVGLFIALGALVLFWAILNRTTLGYEVKAVGFNPDAAAYGGISVGKNIIRAMTISGAFAGLAGAVDMLGNLHQFGSLDVLTSQIGFLGIAVALLGRTTALGTLFGALFFGALLYGTNHGLQGVTNPVVDAEAGGQFTGIIQGLVVLFVGANVLILSVWGWRKKIRPPRVGSRPAPETAA